MSNVWLLSLDDTGSSLSLENLPSWINLGVAGFVIIGWLTGKIWAKPALDEKNKELDRVIADRDRIIVERDKIAAQRDESAKILQDKLIPTVEEFIMAMRVMSPVFLQLQQLSELLPDIKRLTVQAKARSQGRD